MEITFRTQGRGFIYWIRIESMISETSTFSILILYGKTTSANPMYLYICHLVSYSPDTTE